MKEFSEKEFLLLAYLEGDLEANEKAKVEAMLAEDAALMSEYRLLTKTILSTETVEYTNKSALKKDIAPQRVSLAYMVWSGAVAAALAILLIYYSPTLPVVNKVAIKEKTTSTVTKKNLGKSEITNDEVKNSTVEEMATGIALAETTDKNNAKVTINSTKSIQKQIIAEVDKPYEKKQLVATTLSLKPSGVPVVNMPSVTVDLQRDLEILIPQVTSEEAKGWLARKSQIINNALNTWVSYLQKPRVEIGKKEPLGGRTYWALTVTADKYEWEGKLYTRR